MNSTIIPITVDDPVNARILSVSEDQISGFMADPFRAISDQSGVPAAEVVMRIAGMLRAGTIRRVRQTLLATNLAPGALVAWRLPADRVAAAFDYMFQEDPFSGHVVIRTAEGNTPGADYRLWTTLKVPRPHSMEAHCRFLAAQVGAEAFRMMPARCLFTLGVGHVRRRGVAPGSRADEPAQPDFARVVDLDESQWQVLVAMKRPFAPEEIMLDPWAARAHAIGMSTEDFVEAGKALNVRGVVGRFSTFLEHVKKHADGSTVTRYNALFHWAVPPGRELEAGGEVGRHHVMTHAYWREAGSAFNDVNVMGVAHGREKQWLLDHKQAIDAHLEAAGIPVAYTNVFWGGRSEIKPSEIAPSAYAAWCGRVGHDGSPPVDQTGDASR